MKWQQRFRALINWFDTDFDASNISTLNIKKIDWVRVVPFLVLHFACLAVFWVGVSTTAVVVALVLYFVRMFAITGFYHRYFSHKTFKVNRFWQFIFGLLGASATQRGPLWWASHHRYHHRHSDQLLDPHSPKQQGFWWSHIGWFLSPQNFATHYEVVADLTKYPELRWLNRFDILVPFLLAGSLFLFGNYLSIYHSDLHTNGWQLLIWGFFISTVILFHATCTINSLSHHWGKRAYKTRDDSRNNFWLALLTLGEGWHNNHHHYPGSTRQGFHWWQIDITYYLLWILACMRIIRDLRPVPISLRKKV